MGLFELFVPSDKVREKIIARAPAAEINAAAAETGFVQLRHDGVYALLWHNASETAQRRRIARAWLKSWLP